MAAWRDARGFSILEVLVAATLLATALVALGHLLLLAGHARRVSRSQSVAVLLAVGKIEELSGDVLVFAGAPESGADRVDASGYRFDDPARMASAPTYVRRWSAVPLPTDSSMLLLAVAVTPWTGESGLDASARTAGVTLTTVKARSVP